MLLFNCLLILGIPTVSTLKFREASIKDKWSKLNGPFGFAEYDEESQTMNLLHQNSYSPMTVSSIGYFVDSDVHLVELSFSLLIYSRNNDKRGYFPKALVRTSWKISPNRIEGNQNITVYDPFHLSCDMSGFKTFRKGGQSEIKLSVVKVIQRSEGYALVFDVQSKQHICDKKEDKFEQTCYETKSLGGGFSIYNISMFGDFDFVSLEMFRKSALVDPDFLPLTCEHEVYRTELLSLNVKSSKNERGEVAKVWLFTTNAFHTARAIMKTAKDWTFINPFKLHSKNLTDFDCPCLSNRADCFPVFAPRLAKKVKNSDEKIPVNVNYMFGCLPFDQSSNVDSWWNCGRGRPNNLDELVTFQHRDYQLPKKQLFMATDDSLCFFDGNKPDNYCPMVVDPSAIDILMSYQSIVAGCDFELVSLDIYGRTVNASVFVQCHFINNISINVFEWPHVGACMVVWSGDDECFQVKTTSSPQRFPPTITAHLYGTFVKKRTIQVRNRLIAKLFLNFVKIGQSFNTFHSFPVSH